VNDQHGDMTRARRPPAARIERLRWLRYLLWLPPVAATIFALSLISKDALHRGALIEVTFPSADGIDADSTVVRSQGVPIGRVTDVTLSKGTEPAVVAIRLDRAQERFTRADTRYWIERPRLSATEISGLSTLLSGIYIAAEPGDAGTRTDRFSGALSPPLLPRHRAGRLLTLRSFGAAHVTPGAPVMSRGARVGTVVGLGGGLRSEAGTIDVFIESPHDTELRTDTRFWTESGLDVSLGPQGIAVQAGSLQELALGGIVFDRLGEGSASILPKGVVPFLHSNRAFARNATQDAPSVTTMDFDDPVAGLAAGAPLMCHGIEVGEVIDASILAAAAGRTVVRVTAYLYPSMLDRTLPHADALPALERRGLHARLLSASLLTDSVYIDLSYESRGGSRRARLNAQQVLADNQIPTLPAAVLGTQLQTTLDTLDRTLTTIGSAADNLNLNLAPSMQATLVDARSALSTAQHTFAQDAELPNSARGAFTEVARAARSLRTLTDYLEQHPEAVLRGKSEGARSTTEVPSTRP
jgi:paraquat-inducible protein B